MVSCNWLSSTLRSVTTITERKIDKNAAQLKDAIDNGAPIIITTLQKFPVIYKEVMGQKHNFAIIVDEAHSSQTGEAARKLKKALADTSVALEEYARLEGELEANTPDQQDKILNELATQGQHDNLSFFAFTATPKDKTLQMFGTPTVDGKYVPYHIYSKKSRRFSPPGEMRPISAKASRL